MATAHAETPGYSVTAGLGRISRWMIIQAAIGAKVTAIGLWITGRYLWTQQLGLRVLTVGLVMMVGWQMHGTTARPVVATVARVPVARVAAVAAPIAAPVVALLHAIPHIASTAQRASDRYRVVIAPNPQGAILHDPSISVQQIQATLTAAHSPTAALTTMTPQGMKTFSEYLYDACLLYHVDPAIILAIFKHESGYGVAGEAVLNHSLTNQRPVGVEPRRPTGDGEYVYYDSWFSGVDGAVTLLYRMGHGFGYGRPLPTLLQVIPVFAPVGDLNCVPCYLHSVYQSIEGR